MLFTECKGPLIYFRSDILEDDYEKWIQVNTKAQQTIPHAIKELKYEFRGREPHPDKDRRAFEFFFES